MFKQGWWLFINLLTFVVPKKKGLWLFYPVHYNDRFSGNLKNFFLYLNRQPCKVRSVWLTGSKDIHERLEQLSLPVISRFVPKFWYILRAEHIFIDALHELLFGRFSFCQVWHGTGFKNIILLDGKNRNSKFVRIKHVARTTCVIATSECDKERKIDSWKTQHVFVTGSPRNDVFFDPQFNRFACKKALGIEQFEKVVLYAPTFRDNQKSFTPFSRQLWANINEWAASANTIVAVNKHSLDRHLAVPEGLSNVANLTDKIEDIQELLAITDVLVSDYSGIVTDFALTGRPTIFYVYDMDDYMRKSRTFYYDYETTVPGPFARTEEDLLALLTDTSWFSQPQYQEKYQRFVDTFHEYKDGDSSRRLLKELERIYVCQKS